MSALGRDDDARHALIESAISAQRDQDREGRVEPSPAWWDLGPEAREELYRLQLVTRVIEKAVTGVSGTVQAVMMKIGRL